MPAECQVDRGVVFQRYSVFPHLTTLQNVMFGLECAAVPFAARLFGSHRRAMRAEAETMFEAVGLENSLDVHPAQMSGGMQQRLAIAQALVKHPCILLDEPFGALDPGIHLDMHVLITQLWREHALTIVMVTHDISEAFKPRTRMLAFDKRRHDLQLPYRFGATATYGLLLDRKTLPPPGFIDALATPVIKKEVPMTSMTADLHSARAHARAVAGTRVEVMPILPTAPADAPVGAVCEETIASGGYASRRTARGTRLRLAVSNINFFMNVPVEPDGTLGIADSISAPGLTVDLRGDACRGGRLELPADQYPFDGSNPTPLRMVVVA